MSETTKSPGFAAWFQATHGRYETPDMCKCQEAFEAGRQSMRPGMSRLRRFVHDHRICLRFQIREGRGSQERPVKLLEELDAVLAETRRD